MLVPSLTATSATSPLIRSTVLRREVGPRDVLIDIAWAGVCHSDIHTVRGDWGDVAYPLTVGHEIAGTVAAVGIQVTRFAVGDRVGVGTMVDSCRACTNCEEGLEQYCLNGNTQTYGSVDRDGSITQGGYSTKIVVDENFVLRIPDSLALEAAAPLLCAGITTYSPLRRWGVQGGTRVAVIGMGGLGHLAVKFAHALGGDVTVLSRTLAKKADGLAFGAGRYYATEDPATFRDLTNSFDLIINTVSAPLDLDAYLGLLARDGVMVNVGAPPDALELHVVRLLVNRRSYAGSATGSIAETQEMLDFCAKHGLAPEIEIISADEIDAAWKRVVTADVRYRFVIDTATLAD